MNQNIRKTRSSSQQGRFHWEDVTLALLVSLAFAPACGAASDPLPNAGAEPSGSAALVNDDLPDQEDVPPGQEDEVPDEASTEPEKAMHLSGFDAEVARANGYEIVTLPDGSQASVPQDMAKAARDGA